jgi:hypothetical protein
MTQMNDTVHIVCGDSAAGCLRHGLREAGVAGHEVYTVIDDLSFGPLWNPDQRLRYLVGEFAGDSADAELRKFLAAGPESWPSHSSFSGRRIIIWHSPNVIEQSMLRMVVSRLMNCDPLEIEPHKHGSARRATAEYKPEYLAAMTHSATRLPASRIATLIDDWKRLCEAPEPLRILKAGKIKPVSMDYYDAQILRQCTNTPGPAARVIGEVLGNCEQVVSDIFIFYRLRQLIKAGRLLAHGTLNLRYNFTVQA